jgi:XTP/dITP diphosphohydrolase
VRVYCATSNPGKLREFRMAAAHFGFEGVEIEAVPGLSAIAPPEEHGATFEENAVSKALYYSAYAAGPVFADDSGLEVDALGGAPGVHSARYAGAGCTDADNNRLLLEQVRESADRNARFVCVIALAENGRVLGTFRGAVEGRIVDEARGGNGFGYDPLFFYEPFASTFGEIPDSRKMSVSHRGQALRAMLTSCVPATSPGTGGNPRSF